MARKTYSPNSVKRYLLSPRGELELIAEYKDATVRDIGNGNRLRIPEAQIRAYPNTKKLMEEWDEHEEWFVVDDETVKYYGEDMRGYVLDVDGDIALQRIFGYVLDKSSFGHGNEDWKVLVGYDKDDDEWGGVGGHDAYRLEEWSVSIR